MTSTKAKIRQAQIISLVMDQGFVSVRDLAEQLEVSDMSIRRDAELLSQSGDLVRVRGGLLKPALASNVPDDNRGGVVPSSKRAIAEAALNLVGDTDVVSIDAGTTALELAQILPDSFCGTVITHSLPVLELMEGRPQVTVIALGGDLYRRSRAFVGTAALRAIKELRATTFFMGAAAADCDGMYASFDMEKELKRALVQMAQRVVLLVDHSKFQVTAPVFLLGWDDRFTVVADELPAASTVEVIGRSGVSFQCV